ncbi:hypothetical protein [uncultured Duncaniella sp.]|uniref:hypothetical protein n=1 Tax=uncultured Duncaniella sp. TaxID=2768039 RepID=UPI002711F6A6|nr:hypothetical protein [uncultured Duncaniella sp.]
MARSSALSLVDFSTGESDIEAMPSNSRENQNPGKAQLRRICHDHFVSCPYLGC